MSAHHNYSRVSAFAILLLSWFCMSLGKSSSVAQGPSQHPAPSPTGSFYNVSYSASFLPAVATWYGDPYGAGSTGGACGLQQDVLNFPYYGVIAAGNSNLFKYGKGCGACYKLRCTEHPACSRRPIKVVITDECPGACNNEAIHFDLSGKAMGYLAKDGQGDALRNAGRINIQYQRVRCLYKSPIVFKIDAGSNQYYLAFVAENVNGDGDIGYMQVLGSNPGASWLNMQQSWGATWKADLPQGTYGPFSVRLTNAAATSTVTAYNAIPYNWAPGAHYTSRVNFPFN